MWVAGVVRSDRSDGGGGRGGAWLFGVVVVRCGDVSWVVEAGVCLPGG